MLQLPKVAIVAVDNTGGFAKDGKLPWHIPEDLKRFKQLTGNGICVMGRNTYTDLRRLREEKEREELLPGRRCFVVSSTLSQDDVPDATVLRSIDQLYQNQITDEEYDRNAVVWFIGGLNIFREAIRTYANQIAMTVINNDYECDVKFTKEDLATLEKMFVIHSIEESPSDPKIKYVNWVRKPKQ